MNIRRISLIAAVLAAFIFAGLASSQAQAKRVWTAEEILAERKLNKKEKKKPKYCQGGAFKPCVCPRDVTAKVQYRPSVKECGGAAAIILSGKYLSAFSAVVRDYENKDRWPVNGTSGCTPYETHVLGLNKCSVFKVQKTVGVEDPTADAEIHCLGASGYSTLFRRVTRITIKIADIPGTTDDPLARLCLAGANKPLN